MNNHEGYCPREDARFCLICYQKEMWERYENPLALLLKLRWHQILWAKVCYYFGWLPTGLPKKYTRIVFHSEGGFAGPPDELDDEGNFKVPEGEEEE